MIDTLLSVVFFGGLIFFGGFAIAIPIGLAMLVVDAFFD